MDEIEELIGRLRNNERVQNTNFTGSFVHEVGKIYEVYGYGAAKLFLVEKLRDNRRKYEARTLLYILDEINKNMKNYPREIGGFIIRKIDSLRASRW